ncbi:MAG: hypothetical protein IIV17_02225, partial [Clostridia bacterium]|nr:hypothetical protein [Clostridia bacterium]
YYDQETDPEAEGFIPDATMKADLEAFRLTLVGPLADGENAFDKEYEGSIQFTVTASASY